MTQLHVRTSIMCHEFGYLFLQSLHKNSIWMFVFSTTRIQEGDISGYQSEFT